MTTSKTTGHLGEMLVRSGLITAAQLQQALSEQQSRSGYVPLGRILVERSVITKSQLDLLIKNARQRPRLGDLLVANGTITPAQLADALERQRTLSLPLGQILVRLGYATEEAMRDALALQMNMRVIARMLDRGNRSEL